MLNQKDIKHGNKINRFVFRKITDIGINDKLKGTRLGVWKPKMKKLL